MTVSGLPRELNGDVAAPTIENSRWTGKLPANQYTLRAAIFTGSKALSEKPAVITDFIVRRVDGSAIEAVSGKSGWTISMAADGRIRDRLILPVGSKVSTIKRGFWNRLFSGLMKGRFSDAEAETIILSILTDNGALPSFVRWVEIE